MSIGNSPIGDSDQKSGLNLFNSILGEQDYCGSQPDPEKRTIITTNQANKDEALYEEIDESKIKNDTNTYTFKHIGKMIFIIGQRAL